MTKSDKARAEILLGQRRAVVEFGRTALQSGPLETILTRACQLCSEALGTELSKVLALENEGRDLRVIAGIGWDDGVVGEEVVPALEESSEGFALKRGGPVVTPNIEVEERFDYPEFLKRHGVRAMLNVVIPGGEADPPFGLLQVDSKSEREFDDEDIEFLQSYANILGAAIERKKKNEELDRAARETQRLLQELEHRVKNNLAVLSSLVRARNRKAEHPAVKQETSVLLGMIQALAELHDQLSASSNIDQVELGGFLSNLCSKLGAFASDHDAVCKIRTKTEPVIVDSATAIPLGIVTNEFVTNSLKHAMRDNACAIDLTVSRNEFNVTVVLKDDGDGLGDALHEENKRTGHGISLIDALLAQIGAEGQWSSEDGTQLVIRLPLSEKITTHL